MDEATIIAWVDGELDAAAAARVGRAVAADPALAMLADRHRAMRARFAAAFGPIASQPVAMPAPTPAPVISLAAVRAERQARATPLPPASRRWWGVGGAIAASLVVGVLIGQGMAGPAGVSDRTGALALSPGIAGALDRQLSGEGERVRVALSFRDRDGGYCRSFTADHLSGVACRADGGWQLRYGAPVRTGQGDYRMAGNDAVRAGVVAAMIADEPLDRQGEAEARRAGWR
jgi:hypothetical protein